MHGHTHMNAGFVIAKRKKELAALSTMSHNNYVYNSNMYTNTHAYIQARSKERERERKEWRVRKGAKKTEQKAKQRKREQKVSERRAKGFGIRL